MDFAIGHRGAALTTQAKGSNAATSRKSVRVGCHSVFGSVTMHLVRDLNISQLWFAHGKSCPCTRAPLSTALLKMMFIFVGTGSGAGFIPHHSRTRAGDP